METRERKWSKIISYPDKVDLNKKYYAGYAISNIDFSISQTESQFNGKQKPALQLLFTSEDEEEKAQMAVIFVYDAAQWHLISREKTTVNYGKHLMQSCIDTLNLNLDQKSATSFFISNDLIYDLSKSECRTSRY